MPLPTHFLDGARRGRGRRGERTESDLLRAVRQYLAARRIWVQRQNTGGMKVPDPRRRRGYRYVAFGEAGNTDLVGVIPPWGDLRFGVPIFVEVKKPGHKTNRLRLARQTYRIRELQALGAIAFMAESLEDVARALDAHGVPGIGGAR